jgi:hypothetical protein
MNDQILDMLSKSTYTILDKKYVYVTVAKAPAISNHFMISKDADEITVVTEEKNLADLEIIKKNENLWRLVSVNMSIPFMAGSLVTINAACAKQGLNNLIISTFSKDYILIKDSQVEKVRGVLKDFGIAEKPSQ